MNVKAVKDKFRLSDFIMLTLAGIINAIGVTVFLAPLRLFDSGLSGTAYLFNQLTPDWLGLWFFLIVLNFPFYIIGLKRMGKKFVCYSLWAIGIYSLFSFLIQSVFPIDWSGGSPIVGEDKLLAAIFGGLISGIGSGLTIRYGGAIDGVEVMAVMFAKKIGMTVGTFIMSYNVILYTVSAIIFKSWDIPLYSVLAYAVGLKAVDFIVDGLDKGKAAWIVSDKHEEVAKALSDDLFRGITVLDGMGYYSKAEKKVLYVVVNRFEIAKLKSIVKSVDPKAFVAIFDISDTMGVNVRFKQNDYEKAAGIKRKRFRPVDKVLALIDPAAKNKRRSVTPPQGAVTPAEAMPPQISEEPKNTPVRENDETTPSCEETKAESLPVEASGADGEEKDNDSAQAHRRG